MSTIYQQFTFSELLSGATALDAPLFADGCAVLKPNGNCGQSLAQTNFFNDGHKFDAELIARLLNFAHSGGVEALRRILEEHEWRAKDSIDSENKCLPESLKIEYNESDEIAAAKKALSILEGEK